VYNLDQSKFDATLKGHDDSVQDLLFDLKTKAIYSCGSDSTFRIWQ
jgi:WD40 repeat protein